MKKLWIALPIMPIRMGILLGSKSFGTSLSNSPKALFPMDLIVMIATKCTIQELTNTVMRWTTIVIGVVDENAAVDANTYYQDLDNDNYGLTESCCFAVSPVVMADWMVIVMTMIRYSDQNTELCNGEDDDCDGLSDEGPSDDPDSPAVGLQTFYLDVDGDGHGSLESATDQSLQIQSCPQDGQIAPEGYAFVADDCNDDDVTISPSLIEDCDEIDRNCDGEPRLGATDISRWYVDSDGDGFGNPDIPFDSCLAPVGFIAQAGDCDDLDALSNPEAVETMQWKIG